MFDLNNSGIKTYGHMGTIGNEVTNRLADLEADDPHDPSHLAAEPTATGLRADARTLMHGAQRRVG